MLFQGRAFELPSHNKIIFEDGVFKVGELSVTGQLYREVFIIFAFIANAGFTVQGNQLIESRTRLNVQANDLFNQILFELPILPVKIIALITRQHTGRILGIKTDMVTRRGKVVFLVDVLLKCLHVLLSTLVHPGRVRLIAVKHVLTRNDDVYMWFTVDHFASFSIPHSLDFWQMCFRVKIYFVFFVGMQQELLKLRGHVKQSIIRNMIFFECQRVGQISLLSVIRNRLINPLSNI
nr:hypothetical protein [Pseudomonas corrugata]